MCEMSFKSSKKRSYSRHEQSTTSHEGGTDCVWPGPGFDENISINHGYCRAGGGQEEGWWIIASAANRSIGSTTTFHNHGEGPY